MNILRQFTRDEILLLLIAAVILAGCYVMWILSPAYRNIQADQTAEARKWLITNYYDVPEDQKQAVADFYGITLESINPQGIFDEYIRERTRQP